MFKHILATSSNDINWMAILALMTFVSIFVIALFQLFFQKKEFTEHMANLPLDEDHEKEFKTENAKSI